MTSQISQQNEVNARQRELFDREREQFKAKLEALGEIAMRVPALEAEVDEKHKELTERDVEMENVKSQFQVGFSYLCRFIGA